MKITEIIRETWEMLDRSIFVGERYRKNMKSIAKMSLIVAMAGLIMFVMNMAKGDYIVSLTSVAFFLMGIIDYFLASVTEQRKAAIVVTLVSVMTVMTYNILFVSNGFAFLWTILVPLVISYLFSVKAGILVSFYFSTLFTVLFYTPLRRLVEGNYPQIVLDRFPILYSFLFIMTSFVMIQYHRSVLDQIDYAGQMEKARKTADEANKAKSDFLAEMSHEIRTPINAVLGMNEMIMRESVKGEEETAGKAEAETFRQISVYSGNIEEAGNNLLAIINDILDFSKIEERRMELVEGDYELSNLLSDVSNMISFRLREKGLEYRMNVDESIPDTLRGDKVRVRQIIINLLTNAVKYTEKGLIRLEVHALGDAFKPGDTITLQIAVRDTGIGIRQEDIPKLFTKFQRVDLQRNSTVEGTGMGLAITHSLLDMMNGSISVESVYGEGSTFTVTLPQKVVDCEPIGSVRAGEGGSRHGGHRYQESFRAPEARILVVDDTRMNIAVTVGLLQQTGIRIDTAENGPDALELARSTAYDLILMDQRMPGMDGTETLQELRKTDGPNRETPVICMTGDAVIGAKERYISDGFTDWLPKPVTGAMLERTIVRYLPGEKVTVIRKEDGPDAEAAGAGEAKDLYALLRQAGIDTETALGYCQRDESLYLSLLREYVRSAWEKTRNMQKYFEEENWKDYGILVHALKSTSRMIGAGKLGEKAAALEAAAKREDGAFIRQEHEGTMALYRETVKRIREAVEEPENPDDPEEEVLEFDPE